MPLLFINSGFLCFKPNTMNVFNALYMARFVLVLELIAQIIVITTEASKYEYSTALCTQSNALS